MPNIYESDKLLSEYLLFHYGSDVEILGERAGDQSLAPALGFPVRTACCFSGGEAERGLDLGCAVGRSTFEMSRNCREVIGIDFSASFISAADALRHGGSIRYARLEEAAVSTALVAQAPEGIDPTRISFETGDAMNLRPDLGSFDRVHAANLLCRLPDPQRLLDRLPELVKPGGELVLATPCTWLEEFTPPENWPAGSTLEWLKNELSCSFDLLRQQDERFVIRETARKFQFTFSLLTVWRRKA
ncbi:putative 4-mercaptohistidine N1-methyltransferase [Luteolibacter ambystomatis]|uniref:4-mercaptohistidine N1-methyltransferase n=1 Tax=Luteolibacter ambystomatis TaxID=2824561 RepID=A0A975IZ42_9BACT|nr:putative 4-mercaptohistidine N1-methyltransferase [Luteolibacter ambystomatis]QUE50533.1 putative 4-mercaptohistidine N1-methyltransferase [Luteolibacter ambystomatis]